MPAAIRLIRALSVALVLATWARADDIAYPALGEAIPGTQGITYLDLVRQVVSDIAPAANGYEGHEVIDVRHIGGAETRREPPDPVSLSSVAALPVRSDGKDRLLLMLDLGEGVGTVESFTVLALFNVAISPTLLDVAAVGYDQKTYFSGPGRLSLGEGKDIVLTTSMHFDSSQTYVTTVLILVRNDQLQLIDTVFTLHDRDCSFASDEVPEFRAGDRDARTYSDIVATITETTTLSGERCEGEDTPRQGTRTITVTYRWDEAASRFVADSDAFDVLAKENSDRF